MGSEAGSVFPLKVRPRVPVKSNFTPIVQTDSSPWPGLFRCAPRTLAAILLAISTLLGAGCKTNSSVHPQFAARAQALHTVAILPIPATAIKVGVVNAEQDRFPQVEEFRQRLIQQLTPQWENRGFKVIQSKLPAGDGRAITNGFENRDIWMQLQLNRAYEGLARIQRHASEKLVRPEAELLAEYEGADALVFVSAKVITETPAATGTRVAANTLVFFAGLAVALTGHSGGGGMMLAGSPEGCSLEVVLVDGRNGDILWRSFVTPKSLDGPKLEQAVQKIFSRYPKR